MNYYSEPDSHFRDKVKMVLDFATKNELGVDTSEKKLLKKILLLFKAEVDKLDIIKLVNVPNSFNSLTTIVDDLDVGKLKTVPVDLKILNDTKDKKKLSKKHKIQYNGDESKWFIKYNFWCDYFDLDKSIQHR